MGKSSMKAVALCKSMKVMKVMKAAKPAKATGSKAAMKKAPARLTKRNLMKADQPELTAAEKINSLSEKMKLYQEEKLSEKDFSDKEKRILWNKFHLAKQMNCDAASKWNMIPTSGRGHQSMKNAFLWAWLKDPTWGKHFMERIHTLTCKQEHQKSMKWLTYKQLVDKHGKDEADELIRSKSVTKREKPKKRKVLSVPR